MMSLTTRALWHRVIRAPSSSFQPCTESVSSASSSSSSLLQVKFYNIVLLYCLFVLNLLDWEWSQIHRLVFPIEGKPFDLITMAGEKKKKTTMVIRLVSSAGTGFFYTKKKPFKVREKLEIRKFDPVVNRHVLFTETKVKV
ncbi:hypothetical protein DVH24_037574 [Malus domestica]|uniref:50S ribosomal protein L33, chloroplastic n=2 Tax=Malus domestica TaxID=3750 RepID=A0A498IWY2_MALDO|nr:hypothetical protein DVH24_037574 [Malus domestica]